MGWRIIPTPGFGFTAVSPDLIGRYRSANGMASEELQHRYASLRVGGCIVPESGQRHLPRIFPPTKLACARPR